MSKWMILILMAGCGTSDPLFWEKCEGCAAGTGTWNVIADGAEVSGDYDVVGPPDPYICISVKGETHCSSHESDNSSPRWSQTIARSLTTSDLTKSSLSVAIWDVDTGGLDDNDNVCSTQIHIANDDLDAGGIRFGCGSRVTAAFRFHHVE